MFAHLSHLRALLILALLLAHPSLGQHLNTQKLDGLAAEALRAWNAPGCAIAVIQGDRVVYQKGYGVKELGKRDPITTKTVFAIGSTTKAFTTAALAMLDDEGRLSWDDPVRKHLPGFRLADPSANELVTIRDLVSHRTGLSRNDALWYASPWSRTEILERIALVPLTKPFRSAWQYQNMMFLAAGELAGAVNGTTWDELVERRIFEPLEMRSTSVTIRDAVAATDHATPHVKHDGTVMTTAWRNLDNLAPAGSINSNVEDLSNWLRLQMNDGVSFKGRRLISSKNMREMHTPQMAMRPEDWGRNITDETNQMAYGLGWFLQDYRGRHLVSHGGAIDGFRASFSFLPKDHIGVIVVTNLGDDNMPEALRWSLLDELLGLPAKDWNAFLIEQGARQEKAGAAALAQRLKNRKIGTNPSLTLDAYAGFYRDPAYGMLRITNEGSRLFLAWSSYHIGLDHFHYDTFASNQRPEGLLNFQLDASATPAAVEFMGRRFKRTAGPYDSAKVANRIVSQLKLRSDEPVIIRFDPGYMADLAEPLQKAIEQAGGKVGAVLPYIANEASAGDVELAATKLRIALKDSTVYLWMPIQTDARQLTESENSLLLAWLKQGGARREIHFHWNGGSVLADGLPTVHNDRFDPVYARALEIDYAALAAAQSRATVQLRGGLVRVRTPAGTDISFRTGDRPFNQQDGDASIERMAKAKVQVDREIELPSGVLRVAPMEQTANGLIVIPEARFGDQRTRMLRLRFVAGKVVELTAASNAEAAKAAILTNDIGARTFREFGMGFNPQLQVQPGSPVLPYFAYGSGMVRMSLGDNEELGGAVRGGSRRWFFFPDATVEADGVMMVDHGRAVE